MTGTSSNSTTETDCDGPSGPCRTEAEWNALEPKCEARGYTYYHTQLECEVPVDRVGCEYQGGIWLYGKNECDTYPILQRRTQEAHEGCDKAGGVWIGYKCEHPGYPNKQACDMAGGRWSGYGYCRL